MALLPKYSEIAYKSRYNDSSFSILYFIKGKVDTSFVVFIPSFILSFPGRKNTTK